MEPAPLLPTEPAAKGPIEAKSTGDFDKWMSQVNGSIVVTTYQSDQVVIIGWDGKQTSIQCCPFDRPMGMAIEGRHIALATRDQLLVLANCVPLAPDFLLSEPGRYDALFLPRLAYFTGEVNVHDVGSGKDGLWIVNTLFSCLAVPSVEYSFTPRWKPSFISELVPEDRCHLNGLAMEAGKPRFVTALGATNVRRKGWRPERLDGGVVIDLNTGEIVVRGLCIPHSPALYIGWLWVLSSGTGELMRINLSTFKPEVFCSLPGFARGLCFVGPYALVGLGTIRNKHLGTGLPVEKRHERLCCGVAVVDLRDRSTVGMLEFTSGCNELYEVEFLPRYRRPMILGTDHPSTPHAISGSNFAFWMRPLPPGTHWDDDNPPEKEAAVPETKG